MLGIGAFKQRMPSVENALPGRDVAMPVVNRHFISGRPIQGEFPGLKRVQFGMGCFWGVERKFWDLPGVFTTAVGYAGGITRNPSYEEVCSGQTGHNEVVLVVYDPAVITFEALLKTFWENHDPTQGMAQGNDRGTQYRSGIYCYDDAQRIAAEASCHDFQAALSRSGFGAITTEIEPAGPFYYAEDYHQQYLAKNPNGYCGIGGTGVVCPIGIAQPS
jgi:peptide-methionine (S)-S-oxide reductase